MTSVSLDGYQHGTDFSKALAYKYIDEGWRLAPIWWLFPDGACACGDKACSSPGNHEIQHLPNKRRGPTRRILVDAWLRSHPECQIGIVTGADSNIVIIRSYTNGGSEFKGKTLRAENHGWIDYFYSPKKGHRPRRTIANHKNIQVFSDGDIVVPGIWVNWGSSAEILPGEFTEKSSASFREDVELSEYNSDISEVDLAREWLDKCCHEPGEVKSVRGQIYSYNPGTGIWSHLSDREIKSSIQDMFHGVECSKVGSAGTILKYRLNIAPRKRDAVLDAIRYEGRICDDKFFDDPPGGIVFTNGYLNYETMKLEPHSPHHRARFGMDYEYIPDAKYTKWLDYMRGLFLHDDDKEAKIEALQEFFGACVFGKATVYQRALILFGETANNGKSTFIEIVMRALFAPESRSSIHPSDWNRDYYRRSMSGVLINNCGEIAEGSISSPEQFKTMITGGETQGRSVRHDPTVFVPICGQVVESNIMAKTKDYTNGFWRRLMVITFNRRFTSPERKDNFVETMLGYRQCIMAWAVEGAKRLFERGYYILPRSHEDTVDEWRCDVDIVSEFLNNCCRKSAHPDISLHDLYLHYKEYISLASSGTANVLPYREFGKRVRLVSDRHRIINGYKMYAFSVNPKAKWPVYVDPRKSL